MNKKGINLLKKDHIKDWFNAIITDIYDHNNIKYLLRLDIPQIGLYS